jgi:hypothetical protein
MTYEQIDQLPAGSELDALIAEKVMGWTGVEKSNNVGWELQGYPPNPKKLHRGGGPHLVPDYSTQIAAAWVVVDRMHELIRERHKHTSDVEEMTLVKIRSLHGNQIWRTSFDVIHNIEDFYESRGEWKRTANAGTAPLSICRAALKTVMGGKE